MFVQINFVRRYVIAMVLGYIIISIQAWIVFMRYYVKEINRQFCIYLTGRDGEPLGKTFYVRIEIVD